MDITRKLEIAQQSIDSIVGDTDKPESIRLAALENLSKRALAGVAEIKDGAQAAIDALGLNSNQEAEEG